MEALDSMAGFAVIGAAVHLLQHVQVLGDVLNVGLQHLVHEKDVPEPPACPRPVLHLMSEL